MNTQILQYIIDFWTNNELKNALSIINCASSVKSIFFFLILVAEQGIVIHVNEKKKNEKC